METKKVAILPQKCLPCDERAMASNRRNQRSPCFIDNIDWKLILEQKKSDANAKQKCSQNMYIINQAKNVRLEEKTKKISKK